MLIQNSIFDYPKGFNSNGTNEKKIKLKKKKFSAFDYLRINSNLLIEGVLFNIYDNGKKSDYFFYKLYTDKLEKYSMSVTFLQGVICELCNPKLFQSDIGSFDEKNKLKYFFCLSYKSKFEIYSCLSKDEYIKWENELKKCFVLGNYNYFYKIVKALAMGGYAKVNMVSRVYDNKNFAVKCMNKQQILTAKNQEERKEALLWEIYIMRTLNHPNIIKVYEVYEGKNHFFMVISLLKGGELLKKILKQEWIFSEISAFIIIVQLLKILQYIHKKGIMHRDVKPENIMFSEKDNLEISLIDFGLADFIDRPHSDRHFIKCGSAGYVAPEIFLDKEYNEKVDVFSAGVILYTLVSGCSPFFAKTYDEIYLLNHKCEIDFEFKESNIFGVSPLGKSKFYFILATDLLKKMLEKNPEKRFSAAESLSHPWIFSMAKKMNPPTSKKQLNSIETAVTLPNFKTLTLDKLNKDFKINSSDISKNLIEKSLLLSQKDKQTTYYYSPEPSLEDFESCNFGANNEWDKNNFDVRLEMKNRFEKLKYKAFELSKKN